MGVPSGGDSGDSSTLLVLFALVLQTFFDFLQHFGSVRSSGFQEVA
jgi:hypothetical protein